MIFAIAVVYFALGVTAHEITTLEAQDLGIARKLFDNYGLSPDHSPLHFVFLHFWDALASATHASVAFIRAPSVVFAALAATLVMHIAHAFGGRRAGWIAALVFVTNAEVVDAARSLRLYALALLLATACVRSAVDYFALPRQRTLNAFAIAATLAIYNHLFAWLLVGPLAVALVVSSRHRRWAAVLAMVLLPQAIHVFVALGFTHERHALYTGLASGGLGFVVALGRALFFGEWESVIPLGSWLLLVPIAALGWGLFVLRRRRREALFALTLLPALMASWILSFSNPVEPRYVGFLVPLFAVIIAVATRPFIALGVVAISMYATHLAAATTTTDWQIAATALRAERRPDDVVAVFPDYWGASFERYGLERPWVDIAFPSDLDRALASGRRVLLVTGPGRERGSLDAFLATKTDLVRVSDAVMALRARREPPPTAAPDTLFVGGVVGSGGYAWQDEPDADPFAPLRPLFQAPAIVAYEPYAPPLVARLLRPGTPTLSPNAAMDRALQRSGISMLALLGPAAPPLPAIDVSAPRVVRVGDRDVAVVVLEAQDADAARVAAARQVAPDGAIVALVRSAPDYSRLVTPDERRRAWALVDLGVDAVLGIGGFAAKEVETHHHAVIAYSLGTLLRPPSLTLAVRESTGIGVRLAFPRGRPTEHTLVPLTFDSASEPALGHASDVVALDRTNERGRSLVEAFDRSPANRSEPWWRTELRSVTDWFPLPPPSSRPAGAIERGALGLGEYRHVIELDPASEPRVTAHGVQLGHILEVTYGLPDDRLRSKMTPLHEQRIGVQIDDQPEVTAVVPYRVGWQRIVLQTQPGPHALTLVAEANGTHFPVAFDVRVLP